MLNNSLHDKICNLVPYTQMSVNSIELVCAVQAEKSGYDSSVKDPQLACLQSLVCIVGASM